MLSLLNNKNIFIASKPVDFRMSIDGLSSMLQKDGGTYIHDGSVYVFYNRARDKIKCLFWDRNGFVLYYKRLVDCKFKFKDMKKDIESITHAELEVILSGMEINERKPALIEHK